MPKKPKALDLAGWRKSQIVVTKDGARSMTQRELGQKLGVGNSIICRIESGERWPSWAMRHYLVNLLGAAGLDALGRDAVLHAMSCTWRAYSADRKGKTP